MKPKRSAVLEPQIGVGSCTSIMKRRLYAIRDSKMNEYNNPSVMSSDAAAIRAFGDLVTKDHNTLVSNHPADFSIWFVGEFDFVSGVLEAFKPVLLATGSDFVKE